MTHRLWLKTILLLCALTLAVVGSACGDDGATDATDDVSTDATSPSDEQDTSVQADDVAVAPETTDVSATEDAAPDVSSVPEDTMGAEDAVSDATEEAEETSDTDTEASPEDASDAPFVLQSADFIDGGEMPESNVCCLGNPQLSWSGAPEGTVSFALIYDDPDAGDFDHWAVYNIPAEVTEIAAGSSGKSVSGALPDGAAELDCGFGFAGYLGPCPPANHTYRWRLWALSGTIDSVPADFAALEAAASSLSLGVTELTNTFGPKTPEQGATCD